MELPGPPRPRVSRETRLLLATILISIAALWILARLRFPERPATPNPVPPLLTQLAARPAFEDLAFEVAQLESQILPSLVVIELPASLVDGAAPSPATSRPVVALRIRDDVGVTLLAPVAELADAERTGPSNVLGRDPVSGLAIVRLPGAPAPALNPWSPQNRDRPRYVLGSDASDHGASLQPIFLGRLHPATSALWPGEIWRTPARAHLAPGTFVFTTAGAFAGLVADDDDAPVIVPGTTVIDDAERLLGRVTPRPGWLGVDVQALTPAIASATAAKAGAGVIVAWVDPDGPAAGRLLTLDVIEAAGNAPIAGPDEWRAGTGRLAPGESLVLKVRRRREVREIALTAADAPSVRRDSFPLGLTMRAVRGVGAEVVRVDPGSAGARAGIQPGDVITTIGGIAVPTPAHVSSAYRLTREQPLLAVIARGARYVVVALEKS